jgi:hypothetical protein
MNEIMTDTILIGVVADFPDGEIRPTEASCRNPISCPSMSTFNFNALPARSALPT